MNVKAVKKKRTAIVKRGSRSTPVTPRIADRTAPVVPSVFLGAGVWTWVILVGWSLLIFSLLALQDFQIVVKTYSVIQNNRFPLVLNFQLIAIGLVITIVGFNRLKEAGKGEDLGSGTSLLLLTAIMAGTALIYLHDPQNPPGLYWDDWANNVVLTRHILDREIHRLMFYFGGREPFYPYWLTACRLLSPETPGYVVQRFASAGIGLLTVWILYLAGREMGSRRAGLLAAALGGVAKPILLLNIMGIRAGTLALGSAVAVLFTLRVMNKPDLRHFLQWGVGIAFGVYTYSAYRPFMMFVPLLLMAWIFLKRGDRIAPMTGVVALGPPVFLGAIFAGLFAATHPLFDAWGSFWARQLANVPMTLLLFALWSVAAVLAYRTTVRTGSGIRLAAWALGTGLACLLVYPISQHLEFNQRLPDVSVFTKERIYGGLGEYLWGKVVLVVKSLFWYATDRNDMMVSYEAFFDVLSQCAYVLGIAYFLGRPDPKKTILVSMAALGTIVLALSIDTASTKIVAAAPPLCVMAAAAADRLLSSMRPGSFLRRAFAAALAVGLLAAGCVEYHKFNDHYIQIIGPEAAVARQIRKDHGTYRVYLALSGHFVGPNTQFVLNEGRRFYYLKKTNWIPVPSGGIPQDVVVLLDAENQEVEATLRRQYPRAEWTRIVMNQHTGGIDVGIRHMNRVLIRGNDIPADPKYILYRRERSGNWRRRYYSGLFGWYGSAVLRESLLDDPTEAPTEEALDAERYDGYFYPGLTVTRGRIRVPETGTYEWMITPANPVFIKVDGRTLLRLPRVNGQTVAKRMRLEAGSREVVIRVWLNNKTAPTPILFRKSGTKEWWDLRRASQGLTPEGGI